MSSYFYTCEGDIITLTPTAHTVIPAVDTVKVTVSVDKLKILGNKAAAAEDIAAQTLSVTYTTPSFATPGSGIVTYTWNKVADKISNYYFKAAITDNSIPDGTFKLTVTTPAINPAGPTPDPTPTYSGTIKINAAQSKFYLTI